MPRGCDRNIIDKSFKCEVAVEEPDENGNVYVWNDYDGEPEQRRHERGRPLLCCECDFYCWGWPRNRFQGE